MPSVGCFRFTIDTLVPGRFKLGLPFLLLQPDPFLFVTMHDHELLRAGILQVTSQSTSFSRPTATLQERVHGIITGRVIILAFRDL